MGYSQTYLAVIVMVLAQILPKIGVNLGNDELTSTVTVLVTVGAAVWALVRRYQGGGVAMSGARTQ